jgi:hypothetical protein
MNVLVACEFSGIVREAFRAKGHDAWSCDILASWDNSPYHYQFDVRDVLNEHPNRWDLIIAHPPCTYLAVSGNKHYSNRPDLYEPAVEFAKMFMKYADKVCVENPVGRLSTLWRKPDQYVQPWQFGHPETKKTGLWLKGLPLLQPTNIVEGREQRIWKMAPSKDRGYLRSLTYQGIANAMAEQWGT